MNDMPRRNQINRFTPAEMAIHSAKIIIEQMTADVKLTQAVVKLERAQNLVADFVDASLKRDRLLCCHLDCIELAQVVINGETGHPEDETHACEKHIGELLGTPSWWTGKSNESWRISSLPVLDVL